MTFCFASSDVLKYLLLNLTWSLEASNRASKLSRFVFGAEMPNGWHTPEVGFLATVWQQLLPVYFKVKTKQKCSACQKKTNTTNKNWCNSFPFCTGMVERTETPDCWPALRNDHPWLISSNHPAIPRHFTIRWVSLYPCASRLEQAAHKSRSVCSKKP